MPTYEGLRLKINKYKRNKNSKKWQKELLNTNFTIISNNCWGGMIYESYNIKKLSPTVGLFFMAEDYLTFLSDLKGFINGELTFIPCVESKWKESKYVNSDIRFGNYPIGKLSNGRIEIEIFFLHYKSAKEAKEKWKRRCERINWDKLIVKFNDQNGCTEELLTQYANLDYEHKLFFTNKNWNNNEQDIRKIGKGFCKIRQLVKSENVLASYEPFGNNRYINLGELINNL